jgi:benzoyl-CoA reductase/2-hydroxyglutaryl-CoA dehydratase subunit BcrC/BadD/HgdB
VKIVASASPWVPPEWIAAHGLRPARVDVSVRAGRGRAVRGLCPYAAAMPHGLRCDALVLPTICDPMRYTAALLAGRDELPVFLFNVPSTWQTRTARRIYTEELARLSRFLVQCGGRSPADDQLADVMRHYEGQRATLRARRPMMSPQAFARAITAVYAGGTFAPDAAPTPPADGGLALALLGGPLPEEDYDLFDLVTQAGGKIVLDGTEWGERTWPAAFDPRLLDEEPLAALVASYFDAIPDVFRRPNAPLFDWVRHALAARQIRGLLVRRYLWCDLWHAEVERLRQMGSVPVLEIDVAEGDAGEKLRILGRLEAFLETLR